MNLHTRTRAILVCALLMAVAAVVLVASSEPTQAMFTTGFTLASDTSSVTLEPQTGPTLPPDDYDEPEGGTKIATGPTLPPDDYDEPEGGTKVRSS